MSKLTPKQANQLRRTNRVRKSFQSDSSRPRLSVSISNMHVKAQIIDDIQGKTLAHSTSVGQKISGTLTDKATAVGSDVAKKALKAKIKTVVFDRGRRQYHGRVKALAEAARKEGLEF